MSDEMFAKFQTADSEEDRYWLVLQFSLQAQPKEIQEAVWAAALLHWFDEGILAVILRVNRIQAGKLLETLKEFSFVEPFPGKGWNIHGRARKLFLNHLWEQDETRFREISLRVADYCNQRTDDPIWKMEYIYHLLVADPALGASKLEKIGGKWLNAPHFAYDRVEALTRLAREHANAKRLKSHAWGWMLFLEARLENIHSRPEIALEKLLQINALPDAGWNLLADQQKELVDTYITLFKYRIASEHLTKALQLYRQLGSRSGEASCIHAQGTLYLNSSELTEARQCFAEAREIYVEINDRLGEAICLRSQGTLYGYLVKFDDAEMYYTEAKTIYKIVGYSLGEAQCLYDLGKLYIILLELDKAQNCFEQALPIFRKIDNPRSEASCLKALGNLFLDQKEYEKAQDHILEAKQLYHRDGNHVGELNSLKVLGNLYLDQKEYGLARQYFDDAMLLSQKMSLPDYTAEILNRIAAIHVAQEEYTTALEYFNHAIAISPENPMWLCNRTYLFLILRQLDLAAADIEQAAKLQPDHPYPDLRRGDLASLQGDFASALNYYQQVLLLIPRLSSAWYGIGRTHLRAGHLDDAINAYRRAISLTYTDRELDNERCELKRIQQEVSHLNNLDQIFSLLQSKS